MHSVPDNRGLFPFQDWPTKKCPLSTTVLSSKVQLYSAIASNGFFTIIISITARPMFT